MASRKREAYQIEPRMYVRLIWIDSECKIVKKLFVIKDIFLAATLVGWTDAYLLTFLLTSCLSVYRCRALIIGWRWRLMIQVTWRYSWNNVHGAEWPYAVTSAMVPSSIKSWQTSNRYGVRQTAPRSVERLKYSPGVASASVTCMYSDVRLCERHSKRWTYNPLTGA